MHSRRIIDSRSLLGFVVLLVFQLAAIGEAKNIRLRNEIIDTDSGPNRAVMAGQKSAKAVTSGLFLLQFNAPLETGQRAELKQAGVELIQYVPDDAFIAKLTKVSPSTVGALNYVRWIGPYRQEYKIHPRLAIAAKKAAQTNETVSVNILLAPTASAAEITAHDDALPQAAFMIQNSEM